MLGDLNDKLSQVNRVDIMEAVDDKAMAYFKALPSSDVTDEALVQRAKALERIGSVRLEQGHLPAALESYEASLKLISAQARAAPGNMRRQLAYAENVSFIGMTHWYEGDLAAAAGDFRSAESILARAEKINGRESELLFQELIVENDLGHVLESRGRLDEALAAYRSELELARTLVAARPEKVEWAVTLGGAHNNLGKIALMRGDLATAIAEYAADLRIELELSERDPRNNDQRQNVFRVRAILGRTLALTGDTDGAIRDLREAVNVADQLRQQDPTLTSIQSNLALYQMQLSRLLRLTGDLPEAVRLTNRSFETLAGLTRQDPANASWQRTFAEVRTEQAAQSLAAGKREQARKQVRIALDFLDPALEKHKDDRTTLLATIAARLLLAEATDEPEARQLRESYLRAVDSVTSGADDPRLLDLEVNALLGLGRAAEARPVIERLHDGGYRDPAFVELLRRAGIDYPSNRLFQQRLRAAVSGHENRGEPRQ